MEKRLYHPGNAKLAVENDGTHTTVEYDGRALDVLYCCAVAIHDVAIGAGNPPMAAVLKVGELVVALQQVKDKNVMMDMDKINEVLRRRKENEGGEDPLPKPPKEE